MATFLAGLLGTAVYLDDIVVHGNDVATHDECMQQVHISVQTQSDVECRKFVFQPQQ